MSEVIDRKVIEEHPDYSEMMQTEKHHNHIIELHNGVWRWQRNEKVNALVDSLGLNEIMSLLEFIGLDRNSEPVRNLYRNMGYSLFGYWEVFYWESNNEEALKYNPALDAKIEELPEEKMYIITMFLKFLYKGVEDGLITKTQYGELSKSLDF